MGARAYRWSEGEGSDWFLRAISRVIARIPAGSSLALHAYWRICNRLSCQGRASGHPHQDEIVRIGMFRRDRALLALAMAGLIALAACGGTSTGQGGSGTPTAQ